MIRAMVFASLTSLFAAEPARLLTGDEVKALEAKVASGHANRDDEILLGRMYGFAIRGVTAVNEYWSPTAMDKSLRGGPNALHARDAATRSKRGAVVGTAAWTVYYAAIPLEGINRKFQELGQQLTDRAVGLEPQEGQWRLNRILMIDFRMKWGRPKLKPADAIRLVEADLAVLRDERRFDGLRSAATMAVRANQLSKAEAWGEEMLREARLDEGSGHFGDSIFYGHMVLGQVALRRGEVESARMHLLESARTPGSATLNSFGPNTSLADEMLRAGEADIVIEFLELTKKFWRSPYRDADDWIQQIRAGRIPNWRASPYFI